MARQGWQHWAAAKYKWRRGSLRNAALVHLKSVFWASRVLEGARVTSPRWTDTGAPTNRHTHTSTYRWGTGMPWLPYVRCVYGDDWLETPLSCCLLLLDLHLTVLMLWCVDGQYFRGSTSCYTNAVKCGMVSTSMGRGDKVLSGRRRSGGRTNRRHIGPLYRLRAHFRWTLLLLKGPTTAVNLGDAVSGGRRSGWGGVWWPEVTLLTR